MSSEPQSLEPKGQPILTTCPHCQADISTACLVGVVILPVLEQVMTLDRDRKLVPGPLRVRMGPQVLALKPQRCPECHHPLLYIEGAQVAPVTGGGLQPL